MHSMWVEIGHSALHGFIATASLPACRDRTVDRIEAQLARRHLSLAFRIPSLDACERPGGPIDPSRVEAACAGSVTDQNINGAGSIDSRATRTRQLNRNSGHDTVRRRKRSTSSRLGGKSAWQLSERVPMPGQEVRCRARTANQARGLG